MDKQRLQEIKGLVKLLAVQGVRNNTDLEYLHLGNGPKSDTGDYSDVKVVYPSGEIEWNRLSRINDREMRSLMLSIERALEYTLISYENADEKMRENMLKYAKTQRTYDRDNI